jgi:hypothetical protein
MGHVQDKGCDRDSLRIRDCSSLCGNAVRARSSIPEARRAFCTRTLGRARQPKTFANGSPQTRRAYYNKLSTLVSAHGIR